MQGVNPSAIGQLDDGKQRIWLPDEGWVEVEPIQEHEQGQGQEEGRVDEREAGYNADSDNPASAEGASPADHTQTEPAQV